MMKRLRVYQVDAFTTEMFRGNPAGVVMNADGLTAREMLSIAREMNNSETAFILQADEPDHEIRIRYFTPKTEVPVCGHATVAAHYVRAYELQLKPSTVLHKIGIGVLPVEIRMEDGDYRIMMTQGKIEFQPSMSQEKKERIISALGLKDDELDERCPVQILSTGHSKVMIGIKSRYRLNEIMPDMAALTQISKEIECNGYFVFTLDSEEKGILTHGRMFAPAIGINEDPVTGNANGPLGAYLIRHRLVECSNGCFNFIGEQGESMGRSGRVNVSVAIEKGEPVQVKIGGSAVIVFKTEIQI